MDHFIPHSQIVEIQQAIDIVELISDYIPLKKTGANYRTLCPFHEEKTPSFTVNPNKQIFHCFGCHKGGNAFSFIMAYEKVGFPQAVKILAERSGIKLAIAQPRDDATREKRTELLKINRIVTNYYHRCLLESQEAEIARAYLSKRGFTQAMISRFLLGYTLPGWSNLVDYAKDTKISLKYLEELGLILPRKEKNGYYDRFRNRLMFPIFNPRGGVVGFGGRVMDNNSEPTYLNSPESMLFNKGKSLYGLNFVKESCQKEGKLCLVEGYTDVIMAHQYGFEYVVATLGTALTTDQIKSIRRYGVNKVVVIYDADLAGNTSSERSLDLVRTAVNEIFKTFQRHGEYKNWDFYDNDYEIDLFVARLPEGLDPYDCLIQKNGKAIFQKCLDEAVELFTYLLEEVQHKYNLNHIEEKTKAIDEVLETIHTVPNIVKRNLYIKQLSEAMNISEDILRHRFKTTEKKRPAESRTTLSSAVIKPLTPLQEKDIRAGEELIELMLIKNEFIPIIKDSLDLEDYPNLVSRQLAEKIFDNYEEENCVSVESLLNYVADNSELASAVARISQKASIIDCDKHLRDLLSYINKRRGQMIENPVLKQQLRDAQLKGDHKSINHLLTKLQKIATSK
jgi:DNA primase